MPTTRQNSNNGRFSGRGGRGRGRGRGRGGGRRNYRRRNHRNDTVEKPKKFIERCPYIVGTPEWGLWRKERSVYEYRTPFPREDVDPSSFPKAFVDMTSRDINDNKMFILQKKMIDNKWRLRQDDDGQYFEHARYNNKRIPVHTHMASDGRLFKLPIVERCDDREGLGCSVVYTAPQSHYTIESNDYINYFDTRKGRRREKYLEYLDRRIKKSEEIQKEEAVIAKANLIAKKAAINTISRV